MISAIWNTQGKFKTEIQCTLVLCCVVHLIPFIRVIDPIETFKLDFNPHLGSLKFLLELLEGVDLR